MERAEVLLRNSVCLHVHGPGLCVFVCVRGRVYIGASINICYILKGSNIVLMKRSVECDGYKFFFKELIF